MRITANIDALQKSLEEAKKTIISKLEGMVQLFAYEVTVKAIDLTPFGDSETNFKYYDLKSRRMWFQPIEGSAKGGWTITMNAPSQIYVPERAQNREAGNIKANAHRAADDYQLGDTVYIVNSVPYMANTGFTQGRFGSLENGYSGQAPDGVFKPTFEQIKTVYKLKLNEYYEAS